MSRLGTDGRTGYHSFDYTTTRYYVQLSAWRRLEMPCGLDADFTRKVRIILYDIGLECGWIILLSSDLTPLIPNLISLLAPSPNGEFDESAFVWTSDALQEIMSKSALSDGSGSKTLTEPLLIWMDNWARQIVNATLSSKLHNHWLCIGSLHHCLS